MYKSATVRVLAATAGASLGLLAQSPDRQIPAAASANPTTWRPIGNTVIDRSLAGLASGPVDRVWYSADGSQLLLRTTSGNVFATSDFETWKPTSATPPASPSPPVSGRLPEANAQTRSARPGSRLYAFAKFVYSSGNGGSSWDNLTGYRNTSIIGNGLRDLAISPANEDEAAVAGQSGVFRTVDGGKSWSGLNQGLPNLPSAQILAVPSGDQGARLALPDATVIEWEPGQKQAWLPADNTSHLTDLALRQALGARYGVRVTALAASGEMIYLGTADGQIRVSTDRGNNYTSYNVPDGGSVERFWTDPADPRIAIAVLGQRSTSATGPSPSVHVLRTINGGEWDDITGNLPDSPVTGVTADRASRAVYVATSRGVFYAPVNLETLGNTASWTFLSGLPDAPAADVKLDDGGNQLFAAIGGYGVYSTLAPHRLSDPRVVSAADFVARAAAPGSLISVAGARVTSGQVRGQQGNVPLAVLASTDTETQIQVPFDARGSALSLAVSSGDRNITLPSVPLEAAAPAIFVVDGSPMLYDADTGVMLDAMNPARSRGHIQILATGLGRVTPDWPTGIAGPVDNPPKVAATVTALLDRQPVEVTKAVLAPYIGYYLIEIEVPKIVNYGPAELYIQVGTQASNRVRVYIEP
jgi:uncharacterized protein (TIGR03437 family)